MRTIKWTLPFKSMDYLLSLTELIAQNPLVVLITGIEDRNGEIESYSITLKEASFIDMDKAILTLGTVIGAHSVSYGLLKDEKFLEEEPCSLGKACICQEVLAEEEEDLFEVEEESQELINVEDLKENEAKSLLRKVLRNFKKK